MTMTNPPQRRQQQQQHQQHYQQNQNLKQQQQHLLNQIKIPNHLHFSWQEHSETLGGEFLLFSPGYSLPMPRRSMLVSNRCHRPIIFIAQYRLETYYDGSVEAVCFTAADTFWSAFYFIGSITIFFLIPFAILVLLYTAIAYKLLRRHSEFQRPTSPQSHPPLSPSGINNTPSTSQHLAHRRGTTTNVNSHPQNNNLRKHRQQVIFMLVAVVASFFICLLPFRAFTIWIIASPPKDVIDLGLEGYYNVLYFCRIMLYLNSALNPILYNLMSSKFRTGFWRLLLSCCSSHKRKRGLCNRHITTYTKRDANSMANSHSLRSRRPLRREATFLVNSISTSSGTERTSITWRSASTSTSTTGNSGKPPPLPESHSLAAAITDMSTTAVLTTMYFN